MAHPGAGPGDAVRAGAAGRAPVGLADEARERAFGEAGQAEPAERAGGGPPRGDFGPQRGAAGGEPSGVLPLALPGGTPAPRRAPADRGRGDGDARPAGRDDGPAAPGGRLGRAHPPEPPHAPAAGGVARPGHGGDCPVLRARGLLPRRHDQAGAGARVSGGAAGGAPAGLRGPRRRRGAGPRRGGGRRRRAARVVPLLPARNDGPERTGKASGRPPPRRVGGTPGVAGGRGGVPLPHPRRDAATT